MDKSDLLTYKEPLSEITKKIESISKSEDVEQFLSEYKENLYGIFELIDDVEKSFESLTYVYEYLLQALNSNDFDPDIVRKIIKDLKKQYENAINIHVDQEKKNKTNSKINFVELGKKSWFVVVGIVLLSGIITVYFKYIKVPIVISDVRNI